MHNLLLGGPASTALAAIWACTLFAAPASSEMVPLGVGACSGHVGPEALFVDQHGINETTLGTEPQASHIVFTTQTNQSGSRAHVRMAHDEMSGHRVPTRFRMSLDVAYTRTMPFQEAVEFEPLEQSGVLRLALDVFGVETPTTVRVHDLSSGTETTYEIEFGDDRILELHIDPGVYRLILEGSLDAEASDDSRSHLRMVPAPAVPWLLGTLFTCARRRRR